MVSVHQELVVRQNRELKPLEKNLSRSERSAAMPRPGDELIEFTGKVEQTTPKAYLFQSDFMKEPVWVPRSQCEWDPDEGVMKIKEWFVDKNSIE